MKGLTGQGIKDIWSKNNTGNKHTDDSWQFQLLADCAHDEPNQKISDKDVSIISLLKNIVNAFMNAKKADASAT